VGDDIRGLSVHVAARVMATASADEVRVSGATAALLDPAELPYRRLGPHELKGVPAPVELFALATPGRGD
jgi:class 3 adenylate cyclase